MGWWESHHSIGQTELFLPIREPFSQTKVDGIQELQSGGERRDATENTGVSS